MFIFQGNAKATIENLRKALSEAESKNKDINREFKRILREKEVILFFVLNWYSTSNLIIHSDFVPRFWPNYI